MDVADTLHSSKSALRSYCAAQKYLSKDGFAAAAERFFVPDAGINVAHPFNRVTGPQELAERVMSPLLAAFDGFWRTEYLAFGGVFEGEDWVTATGSLSGHFARPWLGIAPTGTLANLRFGEFHRIVAGRAVESYIFFDIPELMIAAGQWPIANSPGRDRGFTGYLPGPAPQDGLVWHANDPARGADACAMVTAMLRKLATEDEAWRPYWHPDMRWYGPAAFGSFAGIEHFAGFQVPFEAAFEGWSGGAAGNGMTRHFTRLGDGDFVCSGGWPSLTGFQRKPFLGQLSEGKRIFMRVCDWWRRDSDLLIKNWIFVDVPHALLQLGVDLFPGFHDEDNEK